MAQLWFKFWAKEYLADAKIRALSYEKRGMLQTLWCFAWEEGSIPADPEALCMMLGVPAKAMRTHMDWLMRFFVVDPADASKLISPRLELDRAEADLKGSKARESAMQRWSKRKANAQPNGNANAYANASGTHVPTQCDQGCVQDAGQGQGKETTPKPPAGGDVGGDDPGPGPKPKAKRRTQAERLEPFRPEVVAMARRLDRVWPRERADKSAVNSDLVDACSAIGAALETSDATLEELELAAMDWLSTSPAYPNAMQFWFGPGKKGGPEPPWKRGVRSLRTAHVEDLLIPEAM